MTLINLNQQKNDTDVTLKRICLLIIRLDWFPKNVITTDRA